MEKDAGTQQVGKGAGGTQVDFGGDVGPEVLAGNGVGLETVDEILEFGGEPIRTVDNPLKLSVE